MTINTKHRQVGETHYAYARRLAFQGYGWEDLHVKSRLPLDICRGIVEDCAKFSAAFRKVLKP